VDAKSQFSVRWQGFDHSFEPTPHLAATMAELHDRMPAILEQSGWPIWLGEVEDDPATLLRPPGDDVVKVWTVNRAVNSPRNNAVMRSKPVG
jgi:putative SOS response-associated peptidase YedK